MPFHIHVRNFNSFQYIEFHVAVEIVEFPGLISSEDVQGEFIS